jgi:hypothetical protein
MIVSHRIPDILDLLKRGRVASEFGFRRIPQEKKQY